MGDRLKHLKEALGSIEKSIGRLEITSHIYETEAWGRKDQGDFYNLAVVVDTALSPEELLHTIQGIEQKGGRIRAEKWSPRTIDIDIILYGKKIIEADNLVIPHPHFDKRNFVLVPCMEVAGEWIVPTSGMNIEEHYEECQDECEVIMIDKILK